jgi:hypothetical protein
MHVTRRDPGLYTAIKNRGSAASAEGSAAASASPCGSALQALQHIPHPPIGAQYYRAGRLAPGISLSEDALSYWRMLTARATTRATVTIEIADCRVMASFAQRESGITSVGLNAAALVNPR